MSSKKVKVVSKEVLLEELNEAIRFLFFDTPVIIERNGNNHVHVTVDCRVKNGQLKSRAAYDLAIFIETPELETILHPLNKEQFIDQAAQEIKNLPANTISDFIDHFCLWAMGTMSELRYSTDRHGVYCIRSEDKIAFIAKKGSIAF